MSNAISGIPKVPSLEWISGESVRPIPPTHKGGTSATAIATPAIALEIFERVVMYAATEPPMIATNRSIRLGDVRLKISVPSALMWVMLDNKKAERKTHAEPAKNEVNDFMAKFDFPVLIATARPSNGSINGAIIMAAITTAVLSPIKPSVANNAEATHRNR